MEIYMSENQLWEMWMCEWQKTTTENCYIGFTEQKNMFVSQISEFLKSISRINEPIPGMFGLFWMHYS